MGFEENVFINCPFDDEYREMLRPVLFAVIYLGLNPRIASERLDSGQPRIQKIIAMIEESKYGIHDLSRIKAKRKGEYFRLNMPFELGLDVGCRVFRDDKWAQKRCLILETERYRYQAAISDLSNSDIAVHNNNPETALGEVRNWLNTEAGLKAPGPAAVWGKFLDFMGENYDDLKARGLSDENIEGLPVNELMDCMRAWASASA